jgi:hypothetical protein
MPFSTNAGSVGEGNEEISDKEVGGKNDGVGIADSADVDMDAVEIIMCVDDCNVKDDSHDCDPSCEAARAGMLFKSNEF